MSAELAARNLRLGLLAATAVGSGTEHPGWLTRPSSFSRRTAEAGRQLAQFMAAQFEAPPAPWAGVREALDHLDWIVEEAVSMFDTPRRLP